MFHGLDVDLFIFHFVSIVFLNKQTIFFLSSIRSILIYLHIRLWLLSFLKVINRQRICFIHDIYKKLRIFRCFHQQFLHFRRSALTASSALSILILNIPSKTSCAKLVTLPRITLKVILYRHQAR